MKIRNKVCVCVCVKFRFITGNSTTDSCEATKTTFGDKCLSRSKVLSGSMNFLMTTNQSPRWKTSNFNYRRKHRENSSFNAL